MNSLQIQYFLTVAEQKSFTEAARILFITQPAIIKQIHLLEQELGAVLFERGKKTVCLTFAGQAFYDYFTQCNFQLELLQKHLEQKKKSGRTPLRFSYLEGLDPVHFLSLVKDAASCSSIPLELSVSCYALPQLIQALLSGKTDIILTFGLPLIRESFCACPVFEVPRIVLYSAGHFPQGIQHILQPSQETFFLPEDDYTPFLEETMYRMFLNFGFVPHIAYAPNFTTIMDQVEQGEGVFIYNRWCRQCTLPAFGSMTLPDSQTLYLVYKSHESRKELLQFTEAFQKHYF